MASGFQRDKITAVFTAMDHDGDGLLTETDFAALTDRWCRERGAAPGSTDHQRIATIMLGWWHTLRAAAGGADQATIDDVLGVVDQLSAAPDAVTETALAMFDAVDEDRDGRITPAEHQRLVDVWNGRPTPLGDAFHTLDLDANGTLSRAEFTTLWTEFWAGDDPTAPGSALFGPLGA
ncbi:EF-hand domain-containing protein [Actinokineospora globicatena]|uniref:EF-hand domain-containing protein n=1 Tax=Actinokineospora globicatena TaxID=103729 RepID=UPI0020A3B884|nr:EF-hand domain-containing protein [Actinokineospora globicatena]MCP2302353.1 Ca2+-binding protein, EF-hand superfamily [Actinokineospora globicatena]GLW75975.1 calcium-binding protein [Actinokineospora globicatena]GLW82814.1 calcium-binding protein [Actinokineospora globicatena]